MRSLETMATKVLLTLATLLGASAASAATVVERIEIEGTDVVRFHLSDPAVARAVGLPPRLPVKARIAVDFDGATLGPDATQPVPGSGSGLIVRVRPEQILNREMVRATIELTQPAGFTVESAGTTVTLRLQIAASVAPAPPADPDVDQPDVPPGS
jgi:hypothetical protein